MSKELKDLLKIDLLYIKDIEKKIESEIKSKSTFSEIVLFCINIVETYIPKMQSEHKKNTCIIIVNYIIDKYCDYLKPFLVEIESLIDIMIHISKNPYIVQTLSKCC